MTYYLNHHWPLVSKHWTSFGLKDWKVVQCSAGPDGSKPYSVAAITTWESVDGIQKSLGGEAGKVVMGDVKNFSNKDPVFLMGDIVGAGAS